MSAPSRNASRLVVVAAAAGALALVLLLFADRRAAHASLLVALVALAGIIVGALLLVLLMHLVVIRPLHDLRRLAEAVASCAPVLALIAVPLLFGHDDLYAWRQRGPAAPEQAIGTVEWRAWYLAVPLLVARAALYVAVWSGLAFALRRWSQREDEGDPRARHPLRLVGALGSFALVLTTSLATTDWIFSLTPAWSMQGISFYVLAGGFAGALGLLSVLALLLLPERLRTEADASERSNALGRMVLVALGTWAYFGYVQVLLVWLADLPREVISIAPRLRGAWGAAGIFVLAGHLVVPAALLVLARVRRNPFALALIGAWLLAMHYFDTYWLLMPSVYPLRPAVGWTDVAALVGVAGLGVALGTWLARDRPLLPSVRPRGPAVTHQRPWEERATPAED